MALHSFSRSLPFLGRMAQMAPGQMKTRAVFVRLFSAPVDVKEEKAKEEENSVAVQVDNKPVEQEEWTEVVHQPTGQIYFWNQKTGETTLVGQPKPGSGDDSERDYHENITHNPNVEAFLPDKTGTYASIGFVSGVFLAWFSQFV